MNEPACLLLQALRSPRTLLARSSRDWDVLLCQAHESGVLARLACRLEAIEEIEGLPPKVRDHLQSALAVARESQRAIRWESRYIVRALAEVDAPVILLKGAAYILAELPPARGRVCSDIDIMVPRPRLDEVEEALRRGGWEMTHTDPYDQHYYRTWTHELPPLVHRERESVIDLHHNLTPPFGRVPVDAEQLFAAARPLDGQRFRVLAPADMVLHCATHVFQDGEVDRALRDLTDLDDLLRHFGAEAGFWDRLLARARQLGLVGPLSHALGGLQDLLGTPLPDALTAGLGLTSGLVRAAIRRALLPGYPEPARWGGRLRAGRLYLRAHWQRMPLPLLTYHLARKGLTNLFARPETS